MAGIVPKELLSFLRISGLFPVASVSVNRPEQLKFKWAIYIYSIFLVVIQIWLSSYNWISNMQQSIYLSMFSLNNIVISVMFCDIVTLAVSAIVCALSSGLNCSQLVALYCDLQRIDNTLKIKPRHSHFRWWLYLSLVYLTIVVALDYFLNRLTLTEGYGTPLFLSLFSLHYTDLAVQLQYTTVVHIILQRFRILNRHILDKVRHYQIKTVIKFTCLSAVETTHGGWAAEASQTVSIRTLSDLHCLLCETIHRTNAIFSWPLLAHMLSLFIHVIIAPYFFFYAINMYSHGTLHHCYLALLALQVVWVFTHAAKLVLLVWPCSVTTYEASRTATIVCKLLNCEMSCDMRKQLETFVLQLLHHDAQFTAFGLFPLQCPILTSIAGAVTTYLVILIQFQNADTTEKSLDNTNILLNNNSFL